MCPYQSWSWTNWLMWWLYTIKKDKSVKHNKNITNTCLNECHGECILRDSNCLLSYPFRAPRFTSGLMLGSVLIIILGVCVCVCVWQQCGILFFFIFFIIVHNLKVIIYLFYRNTSVLNTYNYKEGTSMTDSFLRMFTVINVSMCWWQLKLKACLWQALILPACVMITWMDSAEIWNNYEKKL